MSESIGGFNWEACKTCALRNPVQHTIVPCRKWFTTLAECIDIDEDTGAIRCLSYVHDEKKEGEL
jgi:hypothetical protein